jgi:hypothetical protein
MKQKKVGDEKITFALKQMADLYRLISVLLTDIPTGERHMSSSDLVAAIDSDRQHGICHRPFGFSCSTFIAPNVPKLIGDTARGCP